MQTKTQAQSLALAKKQGVLLKGWFKYISILPSAPKQEFVINPEFGFENAQLSKGASTFADEVGPINIPDSKSFYMVLTMNTLNILTSRRNQITKTVDVIDIVNVSPITQSIDKLGNLVYKGGLQVLGDFDEGYCLKLKTKNGYSYILCNTVSNKTIQLADYIFQIYVSTKSGKTPYREDAKFDTNFLIDNPNYDQAKYVKDELAGKKYGDEFTDIGDWSVCDSVCGGGLSTKIIECVKPIGGYMCQRKVLKKACNTKPCKKDEHAGKIEDPLEQLKEKTPSITLPMKLAPYYSSHRFQQYEECRVKDEDLCIHRQDLVWKLGLKTAPILPGRGLLNKHTFSFYENTKYDSLHRSYNLKDLVIRPFPMNSSCFTVKSKYDAESELVLCGCPYETSSKDSAVTWINAIQKFRDNCGEWSSAPVIVTDRSKLNLSVGGETVSVTGDKIRKLAKDLDGSGKEDQEAEEREARKMSDAIYNVESITVSATKMAFTKEKLLEEERQKKKALELKKLDEMIEKEKEKQKCIETFIEKEKKRQRRKQLEKDTDQELSQIKEQVKAQVENLKTVFSSKAKAMDRESDRLKMEKMRELTNLKISITNLLIDQQIKGSVSNCKHGGHEEQDAYCNARFPSDWFENKHCRVKENFCGVCCDKEFSAKFEEDKTKCLYECRISNGEIASKSSGIQGTNESALVEVVNMPKDF